MFPKNINQTGRIARAVIAIVLLVFAWWQSSWIALFLSLFTFFEAWMSWCVLYQILGKNSCPRDPK